MRRQYQTMPAIGSCPFTLLVMAGGRYNSFKTRVQPVFETLRKRGGDWLPTLLRLPTLGSQAAIGSSEEDLQLVDGYWEPHERPLDPPVALLSWLVRNGPLLRVADTTNENRKRLIAGDFGTVQTALRLLRSGYVHRAWYILEGQTYPDVLLIARNAIVVIEGKRTEPAATTETNWLSGRHQIWRHLDAAWEIRGTRAVYGFFLVEGDPHGAVPETWREAATACLTDSALRTSFRHRSEAEMRAIASCFIGVATWQQVCRELQIDSSGLPHALS